MNIVKCFIFLVALCFILPHFASAQKVSGKWYGTGFADVDQVTNNYMCELLITQQGNTVTGEFNYYFRNGYFSNKIKGTFTSNSRYLYLSLSPVMYNRTVNTLIGVDCPMHGEFTLKVSRVGSTIAGGFVSDDLHKYTCAPLKIVFSKMLDTDPTLKERIAQSNKEDSTEEEEVNMPVAKDSIKPLVTQPPVAVLVPATPDSTQQAIAKDTTKPVVNQPPTAILNPAATDSTAQLTARDTAKPIINQPPAAILNPVNTDSTIQAITKDSTTPVITQAPAAILAPAAPLIAVAAEAEKKVTARITAPEKVLEVYDDSVRIDLYDNGVLDYDTISVFYNKKLLQYQQQLETQKPIRFYVHVNTDETSNELVMYAENLGRIPPNSAIMIITDSGHRYEVSLTSDFQKNAAIRLRKGQKPVSQ